MGPVDAVVGTADSLNDLWEWLTSPVGVLVLLGFAALAALVSRGRFLLWVLRWAVGLTVFPGEYDATWFYSADPPQQAYARPRARAPRTRYGKAAGYKKFVVRWTVVGSVLVLLAAPLLVFSVVGGVVLLVAAVVGHHTYRSAMYHRFVQPVEEVVSKTLGWSTHHNPKDRRSNWRTWLVLPAIRWGLTSPLTVPAGGPQWVRRIVDHSVTTRALTLTRLPYPRVPLDDPAAEVRAYYPHDVQVTEATRAQATEYLTARLPGEWEAEGRDSERCIVLRHPPSPPSYVGYDPTETTEFDVFNVPIGKDKNGKWFPIPLAELAPHTMLSAPTGYAKTCTLQSFIAHVASRGARVLILDPKRRSFTKAFGNVPGITILTDPESQTRGLEAFADEMEWRYQMMERYAPLDLEDPYELLEFFTPWFLVIDEKATLTQNFKRVWKAAGGKGTAKQIEDEELILNLARAALMHVVNASQQGNLETFGSSANRDNHTCRIASGPQGGQAWRMMFPGQPRQKTLAKKGRAIIGLGYENLEEIQLRHSTRELARADALAGVEVRNRDEAERNRRIEEATGVSLADLGRPVPDLPGAGQTWVAVPGQPDDRDAVQPYGPFGVLDEAPAPVISALELTPLSVGDEPPEEQRVRQARDEWVYGLDAAAAFLGMETESFRKARQRAGKNGIGIPGEVRHRNRPAWRKADLREWHTQRPVAGARETAKQ